jgi:hypothetical protein
MTPEQNFQVTLRAAEEAFGQARAQLEEGIEVNPELMKLIGNSYQAGFTAGVAYIYRRLVS